MFFVVLYVKAKKYIKELENSVNKDEDKVKKLENVVKEDEFKINTLEEEINRPIKVEIDIKDSSI